MSYIIAFIVLYFGFKIVSSVLSGAIGVSGGVIGILLNTLFGKIFIFSLVVLIVSKVSVGVLPFMGILGKISVFTMVMSILALAYIMIFQVGE